jgi:CRP-like cAMP-binding protein
MVSADRLKERLSRTLKAGKVHSALEIIAALTEIEPRNPIWPKRAARLLHATDDTQGELDALRRALELQIESGLVLDALASCKAILGIDPDDDRSRDCLDRLYLNSNTQTSRVGAGPDRSSRRMQDDDPLDSIVLTSLVPEARPIAMAEADTGQIHEIPVDAISSSGEPEIVDLRLEAFGSDTDLADIAAAQAVSLPSPSDLERSGTSGSTSSVSLREELANIPLFGDLDPASLHTLIRRVRVVRLEAGQVLFRQGDAANSLYVVVEGAVVPIAEGERRRKLAVLERGEFFGEIGLLTKQPRNATIEGLVDTQLLAIDRRVLWELVEKKPSVAKNILRFLRARLIDRQIRTNLFFAAFAHGEREVVARQFRVLEVADGTRVVEQGKPPDGLFVVLSGHLEKIDRDLDKPVGALGIGDVFGGLSLLEGRGVSTDIVARGKCWLVLLGETRFRRILDANPRLVRVLRRIEDVEGLRDGVESVAAL